MIAMLLQAGLDPTIANMSGLQAIQQLPKEETKSLEHLRMAMYSGVYPENFSTAFYKLKGK